MSSSVATTWIPSPGEWVVLKRKEIPGEWDIFDHKDVYVNSRAKPTSMPLSKIEYQSYSNFCNRFDSALAKRLKSDPELFKDDAETILSTYFRIKNLSVPFSEREDIFGELIDVMIKARQNPRISETKKGLVSYTALEYRWTDAISNCEIWICASRLFGGFWSSRTYKRLLRGPGRTPFERTFDPSKTEEFFSHHRAIIDPKHDPCIVAFQDVLNELKGQACPTLEENRSLIQHLTELARRYGINLYYKTPTEEIINVRLNVIASSKSNGAGYFVIFQSGIRGNPITSAALLPILVAARDNEGAKREFMKLDSMKS